MDDRVGAIYRKKPIEIEAIQFLENNSLDVVEFMEGSVSDEARKNLTGEKAAALIIETL